METCRLCTLLREGSVIHEGQGFVVVQIDQHKVATTTQHTLTCDSKIIAMAVEYFKDQLSSGILTDYCECVGHWGLHLIPHGAPSQASSRARNQ
jgi:hypothetical protein